jgi:hypothetical protein
MFSAASLLRFIAVGAVLYPLIATAQQPSSQPLSGLPPGPFASWPEESRGPAIGNLYRTCIVATAMGFDSSAAPKDLAVELMQAEAFACVLKRMPSDWPDRSKVRAEALKHYEAAKALDKTITPFDLPEE